MIWQRMFKFCNELHVEAVMAAINSITYHSRVKVNKSMITSNEKVTFSRLMWADFSISSSLRLSARWPLFSARGLPHTKTAYLTSTLKQHLSEIPHSLYKKPQQQILWQNIFPGALNLCCTSLGMHPKCHITLIKKKNTNFCCLHTFCVTVSVITCKMGFLCGCECEHPWQMTEYKCKKTPVGEEEGWVTDTTFEYKTEIVWMLFFSKTNLIPKFQMSPPRQQHHNHNTFTVSLSLIHTYTDTHSCTHSCTNYATCHKRLFTLTLLNWECLCVN